MYIEEDDNIELFRHYLTKVVEIISTKETRLTTYAIELWNGREHSMIMACTT